jgi:RNA polymerase sigma-70 factor (ECF subfamily)
MAAMPKRGERYSELVGRHQRRASRIAFHYLRDAAEADEAVQDAFVKAYQHLNSFREELPFEVWFTRILINGCLDRIKARTRREKWVAPMPDGPTGQRDFGERVRAAARRPKSSCCRGNAAETLARRWLGFRNAQRSVFMLSHYEGCTSREVSALTGLNESTGARASVPRHPQAARAPGGRGRASGTDRGETTCQSLTG